MPRISIRLLVVATGLVLNASATPAEELRLRPGPDSGGARGVWQPALTNPPSPPPSETPNGLSDDDRRRGGGTNFGRRDFTPSIPEPSAALLFGAGFAALARRHRPRA